MEMSNSSTSRSDREVQVVAFHSCGVSESSLPRVMLEWCLWRSGTPPAGTCCIRRHSPLWPAAGLTCSQQPPPPPKTRTALQAPAAPAAVAAAPAGPTDLYNDNLSSALTTTVATTAALAIGAVSPGE